MNDQSKKLPRTMQEDPGRLHETSLDLAYEVAKAFGAQNVQVEDDDGLWLTWDKPAFGPFFQLQQRRLTRIESLLWRLFAWKPRP